MPVTDDELRAALASALGRPVDAVQRRPWAYASSVPMEELAVAGAPPMLLKDLAADRSASRPSRPPFMVDPLREIEAYTSVLAPGDAPPLIASGADWLIVERLDAVPLWEAAGDDAWHASARWAADLHRRPLPSEARHLLVHDDEHLRRWLDRATAMVDVAALRPAAEHAIAILTAWPRSLLHGELYPSNVLVRADGEIRAVDWETVGVGPGVLDLAALVSGDWEPARRAAIVAAYGAALSIGPDRLAPALDAARLLVALQWLGWSDAWTPPAEHAHDWLADAHQLAGNLA